MDLSLCNGPLLINQKLSQRLTEYIVVVTDRKWILILTLADVCMMYNLLVWGMGRVSQGSRGGHQSLHPANTQHFPLTGPRLIWSLTDYPFHSLCWLEQQEIDCFIPHGDESWKHLNHWSPWCWCEAIVLWHRCELLLGDGPGGHLIDISLWSL